MADSSTGYGRDEMIVGIILVVGCFKSYNKRKRRDLNDDHLELIKDDF